MVTDGESADREILWMALGRVDRPGRRRAGSLPDRGAACALSPVSGQGESPVRREAGGRGGRPHRGLSEAGSRRLLPVWTVFGNGEVDVPEEMDVAGLSRFSRGHSPLTLVSLVSRCLSAVPRARSVRIHFMTDSRSRSPLIWLWIAASVLIVGTAILCLGVLPLAECPLCKGTGRFYTYGMTTGTNSNIESFRCMACEGGKGISCYRKWTLPEGFPMTYEDRREETEVPPGIQPFGRPIR